MLKAFNLAMESLIVVRKLSLHQSEWITAILSLWQATGHSCILTAENPSAFIPGPSDFFLTGSSSLSSQSASLPPPANNKHTSESYTYKNAAVNAIQAGKCYSYLAVMSGSSPTTITESTFPFPKHSGEGTTPSVKVFMDDHPSLVICSDVFLLGRLLSEIICWCKPRYFLSHFSTLSSLTFLLTHTWAHFYISCKGQPEQCSDLLLPLPTKPEGVQWDLQADMKQQSCFDTTTCIYLGL